MIKLHSAFLFKNLFVETILYLEKLFILFYLLFCYHPNKIMRIIRFIFVWHKRRYKFLFNFIFFNFSFWNVTYYVLLSKLYCLNVNLYRIFFITNFNLNSTLFTKDMLNILTVLFVPIFKDFLLLFQDDLINFYFYYL